MSITQINLGTYANDGSGDDLRTAFEKVNANFAELDLTRIVTAENTGSGAPLYLQKVGNNLVFRSISQGTNIAVTYDAGQIQIATASTLTANLVGNVTGTVTGNVTGTVSDISNHSLQDLFDVTSTTPTSGQALAWNGTSWAPATLISGVSKIVAGSGVIISPSTGVGEVTINVVGADSTIIDLGLITNARTLTDLLLQATPIDFGSIASPSSILLDNEGITSTLHPSYLLTSDIDMVTEGYQLIVTLKTYGIADGTILPYTVTGITSADIFGASLAGGFIINNGTASLTFNVTIDTDLEGETFVMMLDGITPTVMIAIPIEDGLSIADGGLPVSTIFNSDADGGTPFTTLFDAVYDGGII